MSSKMRYPSAVAAAIGLVVSMLYSLIIDWEIVGAVALVGAPLFLMSVALVVLLEAVSASNTVKFAGFVAPLVLVLGFTVYTISVESCDPVEEIGWFVLQIYLVGLVPAYVSLVALSRRGARASKKQ